MYKRKRLQCLIAASGLLGEKDLPSTDTIGEQDPKPKVIQVEKISAEEQERLANDF